MKFVKGQNRGKLQYIPNRAVSRSNLILELKERKTSCMVFLINEVRILSHMPSQPEVFIKQTDLEIANSKITLLYFLKFLNGS